MAVLVTRPTRSTYDHRCLSPEDCFLLQPGAERNTAVLTFRVLAKGGLAADAALASAVACPPTRSLRRPADRSQTRGVVLREAEALSRLSR